MRLGNRLFSAPCILKFIQEKGTDDLRLLTTELAKRDQNWNYTKDQVHNHMETLRRYSWTSLDHETQVLWEEKGTLPFNTRQHTLLHARSSDVYSVMRTTRMTISILKLALQRTRSVNTVPSYRSRHFTPQVIDIQHF